MNKTIPITICLALTFVLCVFNTLLAEVSINGEVDKNVVTTDEFIKYKLTVISDSQQSPKVELPEFTGLRVLSQVRSSSLNVTSSGVKNTFVFVFVLKPVNPGTLQIGPAKTRLNGKEYSTDSFKVEVRQGKIIPPAEKPAIPGPGSLPAEQTTL